jgi:hypothetical protein
MQGTFAFSIYMPENLTLTVATMNQFLATHYWRAPGGRVQFSHLLKAYQRVNPHAVRSSTLIELAQAGLTVERTDRVFEVIGILPVV